MISDTKVDLGNTWATNMEVLNLDNDIEQFLRIASDGLEDVTDNGDSLTIAGNSDDTVFLEGDWTKGDSDGEKTKYNDEEDNTLFIDDDVSVSITNSRSAFDAIETGGEPVM